MKIKINKNTIFIIISIIGLIMYLVGLWFSKGKDIWMWMCLSGFLIAYLFSKHINK